MMAMARVLRRALAVLTASVLALTLVPFFGAPAESAPARAVFLLGDSVMLGSKAAAERQFADWQLTFDAAVNRSTLAGAEIARRATR